MTDIDDHRDRYDDDHDPEPPDEPSLADLLMWTAEGTWGEEAAVWLLDQHGHWLPELERCRLILDRPMADGGTATVIAGPVKPSRGPIGTPSEWQVLNIALALYRGEQAPFGHLTSLDEQNRRLVLHAIAWGMGGRDWATSLDLVPALLPRASEPVGGYSDESPF